MSTQQNYPRNWSLKNTITLNITSFNIINMSTSLHHYAEFRPKMQIIVACQLFFHRSHKKAPSSCPLKVHYSKFQNMQFCWTCWLVATFISRNAIMPMPSSQQLYDTWKEKNTEVECTLVNAKLSHPFRQYTDWYAYLLSLQKFSQYLQVWARRSMINVVSNFQNTAACLQHLTEKWG